MSGPATIVLDPPTVLRTAMFTAGFDLVAVTAARLLGPALLDLLGAAGASVLVAVAGVLARAAAGSAGSRVAWRRGARTGSVAVSTAAGGLIGFTAFPGLVAVLGLATTGAAAPSYGGLAVAAVAAAATTAAGALATGRARPRATATAPTA